MNLNPLPRSHSRSAEVLPLAQVRVTVALAGKKRYHGSFLPGETLYQVKVQAMHHFKLPLAAATHYTLRYKGGERPEALKLSRLGESELTFVLLAHQTTSRFGETLFLR